MDFEISESTKQAYELMLTSGDIVIETMALMSKTGSNEMFEQAKTKFAEAQEVYTRACTVYRESVRCDVCDSIRNMILNA